MQVSLLFSEALLAFAPHKNFPPFPRTFFGKYVLTVLLIWFLAIIHRELSLTYLLRAAEERGNIQYDGVEGNAATLLFG